LSRVGRGLHEPFVKTRGDLDEPLQEKAPLFVRFGAPVLLPSFVRFEEVTVVEETRSGENVVHSPMILTVADRHGWNLTSSAEREPGERADRC